MFGRTMYYFSNIQVSGAIAHQGFPDEGINFSAKIFWDEGIDKILEVVDPLLFDADKYKQRAGAEILAGVLRGKRSHS